MSLERLAEALATVQRACPELAVLAIQWVHLRHPLHRVHEALLHGEAMGDGNRNGRISRLLVGGALLTRYAQSALYAGYCLGRLLWLRLWTRRTLKVMSRQPFDLIVKTWVRNIEWADRDEDFYFGDLQRRLAQRRVRMLLLCDNVAGDGWTPFARRCARASQPRLSALCLVPPSAPWRMLARQWRASRRLRRLAERAADPLVQHISCLASRDCLAPNTARAGLYYWIGRTAVHTWQPRAFMTVYESQGWEHALRWGIKTADASCRVIGYQHVLVFPEAASVVSPPQTGLAVHPDIVLCLGDVPRGLLRAGHEPLGTRLVSFGSFWYRAAGVAHPAAPARRTILVVPEGHPSAVQELFRVACACAPRMPDYTFLLRCHPAFPMTRALRAVLGKMPQQANVARSDGRTIEEDFARSSAVLYRGSAAVIYAVLHGLLPIYLNAPGGYDQDPLNRLPAWHAQCRTPQELAEVLAQHEHTPVERREADWQLAVQYLNDYTGPVTDERLNALIEAAGLHHRAAST